MILNPTLPPLNAGANQLQLFTGAIGSIVGRSNIRLLALPQLGDALTMRDFSPTARTVTNSASLYGRLAGQGFGYFASYNGTDQRANMPDADDLSFGDGSVDSPFSIVALANVTDTAAERVMFAKYNATEYFFCITSGDSLQLLMRDASAAVNAARSSNSAITQGSTHLFGATYDGGGGATAANGITLYQDAAAIASTASNNASYVAMENAGTLPEIASRGTGGSWFSGSIGMVLVCAGVLTATQLLAIKNRVNAFYGLTL